MYFTTTRDHIIHQRIHYSIGGFELPNNLINNETANNIKNKTKRTRAISSDMISTPEKPK